MIGHIEHLHPTLQVKRVVEMERSPHTDVLLESAEASNKIAWRVSLGIALRHTKGWTDSVHPAVEDAASGQSVPVQVKWPLRNKIHPAVVGVAGDGVEEEVTGKVDRKAGPCQYPPIDSPASE